MIQPLANTVNDPMSLSYLGTPYSRHPRGLEAAFVETCKLTARLVQSGVLVYSPIAHGHPISVHGGLDPLDLTMWLKFDEAMMKRCDVLIVAHLESWDSSRGIAHETEFFERDGKPVFDLNPITLKMVRRR